MLAEIPELTAIQVVIHPDDQDLCNNVASTFELPPPVFGGSTRQASVLAGLMALETANPDYVLIHDAARAFATPALIRRAIEAGRETGAAIPALPVIDTIKAVDAAGVILRTVDRNELQGRADAAGLCVQDVARRTGARSAKAAMIFPTTAPWRNGPG